MSIKRKTNFRLTLIRTCGTCGKRIVTSAASPWMRQIVRDGKQATTYFCSQSCYKASYRHLFDGLAWKRKQAHELDRDIHTKNQKYYAAHREQERARQREAYWAHHDEKLEDMRYQRRKRAEMNA
jgi:hypothetical protein